MANLNLSEFTEKTFVADADWTFVWDTAGLISKKVSRNNWLNSGTLTTDAPVTISQTWNGTGSTVFKALVVNATTPGTTSAATSNLLDLQVGGVSKASFNKDGSLTIGGGNLSDGGFGFLFKGFGVGSFFVGQNGGGTGAIAVGSGSSFGFSSAGVPTGLTLDTILVRDGAANTLALRNGAAAQTFRVYNTYTDASNYERGGMAWIGGALHVGVLGTAGTGSPTRALQFVVNNGAAVWNISTAGHFLTNGDNAYDIGASGANRPRNVYVGNSIVAAGITIANNQIYRDNSSVISFPSNGVVRLSNYLATDFSLLQLGGGTDVFPAIARDGAGIKFTGAAAGSTSHIKVPAVAVSALPLAATAGVGARAFVNDATAPVFGSAVTGGGSVAVPVYSDGSAWCVG